MISPLRIFTFSALSVVACHSSAAVLVKDATVTVLLNDYGPSNMLVTVLTPPVSPSYPCGASGNNSGGSGWVWDYDGMSAEEQRDADKVYTLFNTAWLTEMTVAVESVGEFDEDCASSDYIILHNPAYP